MVRLPRFFTVLKSRIMFVKMYKFEKSVNFNGERLPRNWHDFEEDILLR